MLPIYPKRKKKLISNMSNRSEKFELNLNTLDYKWKEKEMALNSNILISFQIKELERKGELHPFHRLAVIAVWASILLCLKNLGFWSFFILFVNIVYASLIFGVPFLLVV